MRFGLLPYYIDISPCIQFEISYKNVVIPWLSQFPTIQTKKATTMNDNNPTIESSLPPDATLMKQPSPIKKWKPPIKKKTAKQRAKENARGRAKLERKWQKRREEEAKKDLEEGKKDEEELMDTE